MHNKITMEMSICQAENGFSLDELVINVPNFVMVRQLRIQYSCNLYPARKIWNVRLYQKMAQMGIDFPKSIFNG